MVVFANLSGGRDSSAMVVNWLECGLILDYILFCDTGYEFPEMYEYIDKLDDYLRKEFGKEITRIDSSKVIEDWAFNLPITKGERKGMLRGLPRTLGRDYCTRESKIVPSKEFVKKHGAGQRFGNKVLIGYTKNEVDNGRVSNLDYAICEYPLHKWGWNEKEVTDFLRKRGIANPLYEKFSRTGCFFCPKQNNHSYFMLYKHFPKQWQTMKEWEQRAKELNCVNQQWHIKYSMQQLESIFKDKNSQALLFGNDNIDDFDFGETCFCKG